MTTDLSYALQLLNLTEEIIRLRLALIDRQDRHPPGRHYRRWQTIRAIRPSLRECIDMAQAHIDDGVYEGKAPVATIRLIPSDMERLNEAVRAAGESRSEYLRRVVRQHLDAQQIGAQSA